MTKHLSNTFPKPRNPEDEIFVKCMSQIKEFPQYITGYNDFIGSFDSRYISSAYKNLNLDSVRLRSDFSTVNIEHHTSINQNLMRRNYEYAVNIFNATGKRVYPFIFYTGDLPVEKITYMNELTFFHPQWFISKEEDGMKRLNNIRYKNLKQEELNIFDILDLIWLPKFYTDMTIQECIVEIVSLYDTICANDFLLNFSKECLVLWIGRYIEDEKLLNYMARCLNMSKLELVPFEEQLKGVILTRKLEKAQDEVRIDYITKLLKHMNAQEVADALELPIESVLNVKNSYSK